MKDGKKTEAVVQNIFSQILTQTPVQQHQEETPQTDSEQRQRPRKMAKSNTSCQTQKNGLRLKNWGVLEKQQEDTHHCLMSGTVPTMKIKV